MKKQKSARRIDFSQIDWEVVMPGLRQKIFESDQNRIRIAEFSEGFVEEEWCLKAHLGYVLQGSFNVQFENELIEFHQGDGIFIEENQKHKAMIKAGQKAVLYLLD